MQPLPKAPGAGVLNDWHEGQGILVMDVHIRIGEPPGADDYGLRESARLGEARRAR